MQILTFKRKIETKYAKGITTGYLFSSKAPPLEPTYWLGVETDAVVRLRSKSKAARIVLPLSRDRQGRAGVRVLAYPRERRWFQRIWGEIAEEETVDVAREPDLPMNHWLALKMYEPEPPWKRWKVVFWPWST